MTHSKLVSLSQSSVILAVLQSARETVANIGSAIREFSVGADMGTASGLDVGTIEQCGETMGELADAFEKASAELRRCREAFADVLSDVIPSAASGLDAAFGKWPGDETDEQLATASDESTLLFVTLRAKTTEKSSPVPAGYHWGASDSGPGWNGRWLIADADGRGIMIHEGPDHPEICDLENELRAAFAALG